MRSNSSTKLRDIPFGPFKELPKRHVRRKISSSFHLVFVFFSIMACIRLSRFQAENELICDQQSIPACCIYLC